MSPKYVFLLLVAIYLIGVGLRFHLFSRMIPTFEANDAVPFSKESASHYRYAKMIAEGKPVPSVDYQAQYPEGLKVTNDSILEEYIVGYLYRILPFRDLPFHRFVSYFVILFSSLSILAVYCVSRTFTERRLTSLLATFIYAVSLPSILRNVGAEFAREHFSLPFIFFHVFFFLRSIDVRRGLKFRLTAAVFSGLCIFVALASWKLCRFYLLIFAVFILLNLVLRRDVRSLRVGVLVIASFAFLAGLIVPHLRADLFLTSLPMMLFYGMALLELIDRFVRPVRRWFPRAAILVGTFGVFYLFLPHTGRFGHVYYTTLYQILFLFRHPQDPSLLPLEARLYWVPGYTHPSLYNFLAYFSLPLLAGVYGVGRSVWDLLRRRGSAGEQLLLYLFFATLVSYLFFSRLHVFFIFFLAIFIGRTIDLTLARFKTRAFVYVAVGLVGVHQVAQVVDNWDPLRVLTTLKIRPHQEELFLENVTNMSDLIHWIRENTSPQSVLLSYWHISAELLPYADRTTVLHTFFEDARMRKKITEFASALYSDEEIFYNYCRQYDVDYFVYSARFFLDYSIVGTRYLADRLAVNPESFVYDAHFYPERLSRFGLRYQNDCFRVYEVLEEGEVKDDWAVDYQPIFDPRYVVKEIDTAKKFGEEISFASYLYYSGIEAFEQGRYEAAIRLLRNSISVCPSLVDAWNLMGKIFEQERLNSKAISVYRQVLIFNSEGPSAEKVKAALERLFSSPVGEYEFEGSDDLDIDSTFTGSILQLESDSAFVLTNPGFKDQDGQRFSIVEFGTYSVFDSSIAFNVIRQEPSGLDYYYLFGAGRNVLSYQLQGENMTLRGASATGGIVSLRWRRR